MNSEIHGCDNHLIWMASCFGAWSIFGVREGTSSTGSVAQKLHSHTFTVSSCSGLQKAPSQARVGLTGTGSVRLRNQGQTRSSRRWSGPTERSFPLNPCCAWSKKPSEPDRVCPGQHAEHYHWVQVKRKKSALAALPIRSGTLYLARCKGRPFHNRKVRSKRCSGPSG